MFSGMFSGGASYTGAIGYVFDDKGNVEMIRSFGPRFGSPTAGAGITIGATSAETVYKLSGLGYSVGGSGTYGIFSVGPDYIWGYGGKYWGAQVTFEVSAPTSFPAEMHAHMVGTEVGSFSFSEFYEQLETNILEEWIYQVRSLGQAEALLFTWGAAGNIRDVLD